MKREQVRSVYIYCPREWIDVPLGELRDLREFLWLRRTTPGARAYAALVQALEEFNAQA